MTRGPVTVPPTTLAAEALNIMEQRKITSIVVVDGRAPEQVAGVVHLHDLWRTDVLILTVTEPWTRLAAKAHESGSCCSMSTAS